jgi:hypothetical protein
MARSFRYFADPAKVRQYVEDLGYQTKETHNDERTRATGFTVRGTTVDISYDLVLPHPVTGELATAAYGLITLWNDPFSTRGDPELLERSLKLYEKLYGRFRRR